MGKSVDVFQDDSVKIYGNSPNYDSYDPKLIEYLQKKIIYDLTFEFILTKVTVN